ncbi:putative quinol monooxygenase [Globicatella sulfidifaciens]|uniref:putative quinol monooxygenase n=1 Tax=Globicatella sulfidifaciens TaxID=136093 RepID=UPI00289041F2|nr:putative quinol monooxygenase [Globicatella sulfidifaciens]MDT2768009.1 putative quinol monooxygenase [Globicatella sulfidifaciens]
MTITINIYYTGKNGNAKKFVEEMEQSGIAQKIRAEASNLKYDYFYSVAEPETVLLVDQWESQEALDIHHATPMMDQIIALREKYDLKMKVERFTSLEENEADRQFIRE